MSEVLETTALRLTGRGVGGVQVFQIEGPACSAFLKQHFVAQSHQGTGGLVFGRLQDVGEVVDEVLLLRNEDGAQLSLHGGRALERRFCRLLDSSGITLLSSATAATHLTLWESELRSALQGASSVQAVLFLAAAGEGSLLREVESILQFLRTSSSTHLAAAQSRIESLLSRASFGCALFDPPLVGVFGAPNVGKSTLFNGLLGLDRSLVSGQPGTTRDVVKASTEWSGFPFVLHDTAGLRDAETNTELEGVLRAQRLRERADISLLVVASPEDVSDDLPGDCIGVLNQIDTISDDALQGLKKRHPQWIFTSALEHVGLADLRHRVVFRSVFGGATVRELPCPFTPRQVDVLERALHGLTTDAAAAVTELVQFNTRS